MSKEKSTDIGSQVQSLPYEPDESKTAPSPDPEKAQIEKSSNIPRKPSLKTWVYATWAVFGHCISSVGIALFILLYMADRGFNPTDHLASVQAIGANVTLPFNPTQPNIVTALSGILYVQKLVHTIWTGPLCWRIAIFLMETKGLNRRDFKMLIKYQTLSPYTYFQTWTTFLVGALFLASFAANASELILTGSISWVPRNQLAGDSLNKSSIVPVTLYDFDEGDSSNYTNNYYIQNYKSNEFVRKEMADRAVNLAKAGWGHDTEKDVYKRVSYVDQIGSLAINSTIENITLPYFEVHSLEWIKNASDIPNFPSNSVTPVRALLQPLNDSSPVNLTSITSGCALLIPNVVTNWSNDPLNSTIISERRLLILRYGYDDSNVDSGVWSRTRALPEDALRAPDDSGGRNAFAWVTFSAGVGRCEGYSCTISSPSTVQNNTPIALEPHRLTAQALSLAPNVSLSLANANSSVPFLWDNIDDYVEAVLVRSYSGAWAALNYYFAETTRNHSYVPAYPVLMADVDEGRVYWWLGIQLFAALLGTIFLVCQSTISKFPFSGDASLDAFYLDATELENGHKPDPFEDINGNLIVVRDGDRLKVKVA